MATPTLDLTKLSPRQIQRMLMDIFPDATPGDLTKSLESSRRAQVALDHSHEGTTEGK